MALNPERELHKLLRKAEGLKVTVRAKVDGLPRVVQQQFGYVKVRYRTLENSTVSVTMFCARRHVWMARKPNMRTRRVVRQHGT